MYDRAPRLLRLTEGGSTEEHVGPGSYQVPFLKPQATGCYAPFLSLSSRQSAYTVAANTARGAPGPAHYNISQAQKISRAPTVSRSIDVPSIPSCGQSYGYHLNEDGSIIKRSPPAADSTIGPAYYKPQFDASKPTAKYRGTNFGNSTGRQKLLKNSGPGPGQYDITQERTLHYENINIKKDRKQNHRPFIPRLYEVIVLQEEKKGVPGPGKYEIRSQFQKMENTTVNVKDESSVFLSESERFATIKSTTPAPGTYNETRTALKYSKKASGLNFPFGQSTSRFIKDSSAQKMPGPGFYDILNKTITANVKNTHLKKQKKTAFGSSVPRILVSVQKEVSSSPGPCDYQDAGIPDLPNLINHNAAFLSRTERPAKEPDTMIPAPGTYDVQKSYDMSQIKHHYMPPRSSMAKKKHSSFLSATPRYLRKIDDGPGPTTYNPVLKTSCGIPSFVRASKRFEHFSKEISPGPTTYELSPYLKHSVLKRTYNVTLPYPFLTQRKNACTPVHKVKQNT